MRTWAHHACVESAPRPACEYRCPHFWSSQNVSSLPPSIRTVMADGEKSLTDLDFIFIWVSITMLTVSDINNFLMINSSYSWPDTWSMSPGEPLEHRQRQCQGAGGSDEMKACFWALLAWNQQRWKMKPIIITRFGAVVIQIHCTKVTSLFCNKWSPCLFHEDFEAIRAGGRNRKVKTVAADTPNDGRRVHIFVGNLSS